MDSGHVQFQVCHEERLAHLFGTNLTYWRGAHGSKARTSWSGRPEVDDYTSFVACFIHYIGSLQPYTAKISQTPQNHSLAPVRTGESCSDDTATSANIPTVILGGYSYGSLILKHLPPVPTILQSFANPIAGSTSDEILIRSRTLAQQSNTARSQEREGRPRMQNHEKQSSVIMGGEETTPDKRKSSRDIRRSVDRGPSGEFGNRLRSFSHSHCRRRSDHTPISQETVQIAPMKPPEVHYLLISPLSPPISSLAAPALGQKLWSKSKVVFDDLTRQHATLAVYGDSDIFTSAKRIRYWCEQLKSMSGSRFSSVEVPGAGHFWVEGGVEQELRNALSNWSAVRNLM